MSALTLRTRCARRNSPSGTRFVGRSPDGCVYAQSGYLGALTAATGAGFRIVAARRAGALAGGIALYETRDALHGTRAGPRLLLYYHGAILATYEGAYPSQHTSRDLEIQSALVAYVESLGYDRVILKSRSTVRTCAPIWRAAGRPHRATPTWCPSRTCARSGSASMATCGG